MIEVPDRRPIVRSLALVMTSLGFILVGVARMKLAATQLGVEAVATFGQASLVQGLVLTLSIAGIVTAGRIAASDGSQPRELREAAAARLFRRPAATALMLSPVLVVLAPLASRWILGTDGWTFLFVMMAAGLVPLVLSQICILIVQVLGSVRELVQCACLYAFSGVLGTTLLLYPGREDLGSTSFFAAPLLQLVSMVVGSPTLRRVVRRTGAPATASTTSSLIARAAFLVSVLTLGPELALRSLLAHSAGIREVALLQPGQLLAAQAFTLVTASVTQVLMVDQNLHADRASQEFRRGPCSTAIAVGWVSLTLASLVAVMGAPLIRLFFSAALAPALPLLLLALAVEPIRAVVWVGGNTLLPQGRVRAWALTQIVWVLAMAGTTLVLLPRLGVTAVPLGQLAGAVVNLGLTAAILRPRLSVYRFIAAAALGAGSVALALSYRLV